MYFPRGTGVKTQVIKKLFDMKLIYKFCLIIIAGLLFSACERDDMTEVQVNQPTNVDADLKLSNDNSGLLTIIPKAVGANYFIIDFGDDSDPSDPVLAGNQISHTYGEGEFTIGITARNLTGGEATAFKTVLISFDPPENLDFTITRDTENPLKVFVTPTADKAIGFEVDFGESDDDEPVFILAGESAEHIYAGIGTYTITVTALSGGEATLSLSKEVEITDPFVLPIDFESPTVDYAFNNFGGGEGDGVPIVDNPDPNDVNSSSKVGAYTKVAGSEDWAGTSARLNENIDFSSTQAIAMDVYSPAVGVPVLFKVEQDGNPEVFAELVQNTSVANEWETLTFNLVDVDPNESYSIIAIFFNFGTSGTGETYYFDNIRLTNPVQLGLPLDFESGPSAYQFIEFGGAPVSVVTNPDISGINTSANVAELLKAPGSEVWAGAFIDLDVQVDFGISSTLSLKVWSPEADIPVVLKIENPETGAEVEVSAQVPVAQEWVELEFDFSSASTSEAWTRVVFFFNFGTAGTGELYYFDDLAYAGDTGPTSVKLPLTFEGSLDYTWENFGGAETEVINNPDPSGINTSNRVAQLFKSAGSEVWAGSFIDLDEAIDFNSTRRISMKVWSPIEGATVLLKLETTLSAYEIEVPGTVAVAEEWSEVIFDFSDVDLSELMNRVVVFMDFGNPGGDDTFYFDDIQLIN
ncbi:MAG: hypothetical protein EA409_11060 [Saprospirales bacterium]|nr:MAG: hypothetical protein EA409_11060 [Saprospirales bacterium]